MAQLVDIIRDLKSNDNELRRRAEQLYEQGKATHPEQVVGELLQLVLQSPDLGVRAFSAVLLRRCIERKAGVWDKVSPALQANVKNGLLQAVQSETHTDVRRKVAHDVAELATMEAVIGENGASGWPELLPVVVSLCQQKDPQKREAGLDLFHKLSDYVPEIILPHQKDLREIFAVALVDENNLVQVAALRAIVALLIALEERAALEPFKPLLPLMLKAIEISLQHGDELVVRDALAALVDVAAAQPEFLRPSLGEVGRAMLFIAQSKALDAGTRKLGAELLVSLAESAPGMVRKSKWLVQAVLPLAMEILCTVEEDPLWGEKENELEDFGDIAANDEDGENLPEFAAEAIDRIGKALGGQAVLPVAFPLITSYLQADDWKRRRAALYSLALLAEGCRKVMLKDLGKVVAALVPFTRDNSPRVRYAAVLCLGQFAEEFGEREKEKSKNFQDKFHAQVVPALMGAVSPNELPRIQSLAASGLVNFCHVERCRLSALKPYVGPLLQCLFDALRHSPRQVKEQTITAIGCVAQVIGEDFQHYYDLFMPLASEILLKAEGTENALLRGKAMEAVALVGQSVGKERFLADAQQVMGLFLRLQDSDEVSDKFGTLGEYLTQSCTRIGRILGADFVPYLPRVLPHVLKQAQYEPEFVIQDEEETGEIEGLDVVVLQVRGMGTRRMGLNTAALQEKATACHMLYQYALDLGGHFLPFVQDTAQTLVPLIRYRYMEQVRLAAILGQPRLLDCAISGLKQEEVSSRVQNASSLPQALLEAQLEPLLQALREEEEMECLCAVSDALSETFQLVQEAKRDGLPITIPLSAVPHVVTALRDAIGQSIQRRRERAANNAQDPDYDEEAADADAEAEEMEDDFLTSLTDAVGYLMKMHKEEFFDTFAKLLYPFVGLFFKDRKDKVLLELAICMMDDVIEHCGERAQAFLPEFLPVLGDALSDRSSDKVRKSAAYGVGVCADFGGATFDPHAGSFLSALVGLIQEIRKNNEEEEDFLLARDTAIAAVWKILVARPTVLEGAGEGLWPTLLSWLPLRHDLLEAQELHSRLLDLAERGDPRLMGKNLENLSRLLAIFADILAGPEEEEEEEEDEEEGLITPEDAQRMLLILGKIQQQVDPAIVNAAWSSLSEEQRQQFQIAQQGE